MIVFSSVSANLAVSARTAGEHRTPRHNFECVGVPGVIQQIMEVDRFEPFFVGRKAVDPQGTSFKILGSRDLSVIDKELQCPRELPRPRCSSECAPTMRI